MKSGELTFINLLVGSSSLYLFLRIAFRGRSAVNISAAGPELLKSGTRCAPVVIHFPKWTYAIGLIGLANGLYHITSNQIAEIGEAVEWFQGAAGVAKPSNTQPGNAVNFFRRVCGCRKDTLRVDSA